MPPKCVYKTAKLLLLPFKDDKDKQVVESLLLPEYPLWVNEDESGSGNTCLNYEFLACCFFFVVTVKP